MVREGVVLVDPQHGGVHEPRRVREEQLRQVPVDLDARAAVVSPGGADSPWGLRFKKG